MVVAGATGTVKSVSDGGCCCSWSSWVTAWTRWSSSWWVERSWVSLMIIVTTSFAVYTTLSLDTPAVTWKRLSSEWCSAAVLFHTYILLLLLPLLHCCYAFFTLIYYYYRYHYCSAAVLSSHLYTTTASTTTALLLQLHLLLPHHYYFTTKRKRKNNNRITTALWMGKIVWFLCCWVWFLCCWESSVVQVKTVWGNKGRALTVW